MRATVVSGLAWILFSAIVVGGFPLAVLVWAVTAPFDARRTTLHLFVCHWLSVYTWLTPLYRIRVLGRERIRPGRAYVLVANHESMLDILALFRLRVPFRWVCEAYLLRYPIAGWLIRRCRYLPVRRGDRDSVRRMLAAAEVALRDGVSVLIFPEGTRSTDGAAGTFRAGAFVLAKRVGVPILPITVDGAGTALRRGALVVRDRPTITVQVLETISPESFARMDVDDLATRVRRLFVESAAALR
jgi:1-acyl-sn-glycerol-3-phosphate acyltransferase